MDDDGETPWARLKMRAWGLFVLAAMFVVPGGAILLAASLLE